MFRPHSAVPDVLRRVHRFRAVDQQGLLALAKDITRLTVDRIDINKIHQIVKPPKGEKWGSLKSLENLMSMQTNANDAHQITSSLVGVYELRNADAHLPSSKLDNAFNLLEVDHSAPFVHQGRQMLHSVVSSLSLVEQVINSWK